MWAGHIDVRPVVPPDYRTIPRARTTEAGGTPADGRAVAWPYRVGMSDATPSSENPGFDDMARDIAEVPAVEVIVTVARNNFV